MFLRLFVMIIWWDCCTGNCRCGKEISCTCCDRLTGTGSRVKGTAQWEYFPSATSRSVNTASSNRPTCNSCSVQLLRLSKVGWLTNLPQHWASRKESIVMSLSVGLCLSVCSRAYPRTARHIFWTKSCVLPVAVARSFCGSIMGPMKACAVVHSVYSNAVAVSCAG